jgi:dienelactone hydrolase
MPTFYTSESYLKSRLDSVSRQMGFRATSVDGWRIWRSELRATLHRLMGLDRMTPTSPNPRVTAVVPCEGYTRERVEIDTEPGVTMTLYVLVPNSIGAKSSGEPHTAPAVIAAHGHDSAGKENVAGVDDIPLVKERTAHYQYNYGQVAAQHGYVVFCPDARGFGERRESFSQRADQQLNSSCHQLAHMALPLGMTVAGMWTWDLMRLLDYIATRPECHNQPVGCIGLSGGGLQTLYLSALDDRVSCAINSGYFYGVKDSLLTLSNNCDCNYVPHLWEKVDMGDLGALVAPRPLLIESGRRDDLNGARGIDNVLEQYSITQQAYTLLGAQDHLDLSVFDGPHMWDGKRMLPWLEKWLR